METITSMQFLVKPGQFITKLDIKDGYSSLPINQLNQTFLEFYFNSTVYQDVPLPNRYTESPRKFTKLLKPPISLLRKVEKIIIADYFGDLMSYTYDTHPKNIGNIIKMETLLDFCGSPNKAFVYAFSQNRKFQVLTQIQHDHFFDRHQNVRPFLGFVIAFWQNTELPRKDLLKYSEKFLMVSQD